MNTTLALVAALKALTIAAWNSGNESLFDLTCAGEEAVRLVEPDFALCMWTAPDPSCVDSESSLYAQALIESDCAPAASVAGEDNGSGSQSR